MTDFSMNTCRKMINVASIKGKVAFASTMLLETSKITNHLSIDFDNSPSEEEIKLYCEALKAAISEIEQSLGFIKMNISRLES